ncbi:hypothetical protein ATN00_21705 (plasmid) [Sphingobium baderi]|uniref:Amidohydrolase-related domain-containing protein n=1 Tax=Sphingobium baderi TaxID=1332080 RepID=A0A0S3F646_9SPHN|nr:amidohydrolase family protein [Sphingobium baderi]ALR23100.1 hypothetical protein ATN00_21705 [Sphingobium baderi]
MSNDRIQYPLIEPDPAAPPPPPVDYRQFGTGTPTPDAMSMIRWMDEQHVQAMAAIQKRGTYGTDNRYILDSARADPSRFFPVIILDPLDRSAHTTLRDLVATRALSGLRLTGVAAPDGTFPWLESDAAHAMWALAESARLPIEIMVMPFGRPKEALAAFARLSERFPHVPLVIDHLNWPPVAGAPDFGLGPDLLALSRHPNVFYKFTTINMDRLQDREISPAAFLRHAVDSIGADHIMWGSDMGNTPGTYAQMVGRAVDAARLLGPLERRAVLYDTGYDIFATRR